MIRHLLFDADGVLQSLPAGWLHTVEEYFGDRTVAMLEQIYADELAALSGEEDFLPLLRRAFADQEIQGDPDVFYDTLWNGTQVSAASHDLLRRLRSAGYGVHLGSNQHRERAAFMRGTLGYDDLFDVSCYSCELGAAKPDVEFFRRAVKLIGAPADEVLFVDDLEVNVAAARAAGLHAERWEIPLGMARLHELLAKHGVRA